jgi:diguanylate cyclase
MAARSSLLRPRTALANAVKLADKLRETIKACAQVQTSSETELSKLTLSVGIAIYQTGEPLQAFVQRADRCPFVPPSRPAATGSSAEI